MRARAAIVLLALAACQRPAPQATGEPLDTQRIALPAAEAPVANADGKAQWSLAGGVARFAVPGAEPLLTLDCRAGKLVITRPIVAEIGAGALFAIEGPRRIVRIPVDATPLPGRHGYVWQGTMDGKDGNSDVFAGAFTGTLPGGGMIKVIPGEPPRDVLRRCRKT